jgi:hypothetical protein
MNWKFLGIVIDGSPFKIGNIDVWEHKWSLTSREPIIVPVPHYPNQQLKMSIFEINSNEGNLLFAAGEYSSHVWGFYIPE